MPCLILVFLINNLKMRPAKLLHKAELAKSSTFAAMIKLDVLAVAVHPDDVELGCAGTLLMEKRNGKKTGVVDLTRGELGTRGSAELRAEEAPKAAAILQRDVRENLGMADGFFRNDE